MHSWSKVVSRLHADLKDEKAKRVFVSTTLSDARQVIREQKKHIAKLERRYARLRARKKFRLSKLWSRK